MKPNQNSAGLLPRAQRSGDSLVMSFTQPAGVAGITYGAEWSATLLAGDWHPLADTGSGSLHTFSVPIGTNPNMFMRLKISGGGAPTLSALETWRQTNFGDPSNSGSGADLNDPDNDGIVNLLEYAFALNPKQNSAGLLPRAQRSGDNLVLSFTQPAGVSGITYGAEWSATLQAGDWHPITDTGTGNQHTFSVPDASNTTLFMRLRVSSP